MAIIPVPAGSIVQPIIDNANAGDILDFLGNPASQAFNVNKSLELQGNGFTIDGLQGVPNPNIPSQTVSTTCNGQQQSLPWTFSALVSVTAPNVIVDGLNITRSAGRGISVFGAAGSLLPDVTIRNLEVSYSNSNNVWSNYVDNLLATNIDSHHSGMRLPYARGPAFLDWPVGFLSLRSTRVKFIGNRVYQCWGEGIGMGRFFPGTVDNIMADNDIWDNFALQMYVNGVANLDIINNRIGFSNSDEFWRGCTTAQSAIWLNNESQFQAGGYTPNRNIRILGNILFGTDDNININVQGNQSNVGNENIEIAYNTLLDPKTGAAVNFQMNNSAAGNYTNIEIHNNAFGGAGVNLGGAITNEISWRDNCWEVTPAVAAQGPGDTYNQPLDLANPITNLPPSSFPINPDNYLPNSTSPLIDSGTGPVAPDDMRGTARSSGAGSDKGALELASDTVSCSIIGVDSEADITGLAQVVINYTCTDSASFDIDWGDGTSENGFTASTISHNYSSPGFYGVKVDLTCTDGVDTCTDTQTILVFVPKPCICYVVPANLPPEIVPINDRSDDVGDFVSIPVMVSDPEMDAVDCEFDNLPPGVTVSFGDIVGTLTTAGIYNVCITCTDVNGNEVQEKFVWTVLDPSITNWFVDSSVAVSGDGTIGSPWKDFSDIDYAAIDASTDKTVYVAGGTYRDVLAPTGTVETIVAQGSIDHVGPRPEVLPQCGETNFTAYNNTGQPGIDLTNAPSGLEITGSVWQGWTLRRWQSDAVKYGPSTDSTILRYFHVHDNGYVSSSTSWDCNRNVCSTPLCTYNGPAVAFPNGAGFRIAGTSNIVEYIVVHDNGQDSFQSANGANNLNDFAGRFVWSYNARPNTLAAGSGGPLEGPLAESFNYCSHTDSNQIYSGGTVSVIYFEASVFGPNHSNGAIFGEPGLVTVNQVELQDIIIVNSADNGLLSNSVKNDSWFLNNITIYGPNTKNSHLQATNGSEFWRIGNMVIAGQSSYGCTNIDFTGAGTMTDDGNNYRDTAVIALGGGAANFFTPANITFTQVPTNTFDVYFDLTPSVASGASSGTIGGLIGATIAPGGPDALGNFTVS